MIYIYMSFHPDLHWHEPHICSDNNSEDSLCCPNPNSTADPRQFGELFIHGRVGEDGHTKSEQDLI